MHLRKPVIWITVIAGSVILFLLDLATGPLDPGPHNLGQMFAPAPLDVFGDINFTDLGDIPWMLLIVVALRIAFVAAVIGAMVSVRPSGRGISRLAGVYGVSWLAFGVLFGMAALYVGQLARAAESLGSAWAVWGILLLQPLVLMLFVVVISPLSVRALTSQSMRPRLRDGSIWVFAALSVWLWAFVTPRLEALGSAYGGYALAFAILAAQSVILGAIAGATAERSAPELADVALDDSQVAPGGP